MANSYKGKIVAIEGVQSIQREGKEPFEKRRLMLDCTRFDGLTGERGYEKRAIFEFNGKNAHVPDEYKVGDIVEVFFDIESFEAKKKDGTKEWYTTIRGYKITPCAVQKAERHEETQAMPFGQKMVSPVTQTTQSAQPMYPKDIPF